MNAIALITILFVRALIPFGVLIAIGEWIKRHDKHYWLHQ